MCVCVSVCVSRFMNELAGQAWQGFLTLWLVSMELPVKRCVISRAHTAGLWSHSEKTPFAVENVWRNAVNIHTVEYDEFWLTRPYLHMNGEKQTFSRSFYGSTTFLLDPFRFFLKLIKGPEVHEQWDTQESFKLSASILMGTCHQSIEACQECKERQGGSLNKSVFKNSSIQSFMKPRKPLFCFLLCRYQIFTGLVLDGKYAAMSWVNLSVFYCEQSVDPSDFFFLSGLTEFHEQSD